MSSTESTQLSHANRAGVSIFIAVFTNSVVGIAVLLRCYTRHFLLRQLGIDDYCAIAAFFCVFACTFATTYNVKYGLGKHIWDVNESLVPLYVRSLYVSIVMYNTALLAIKITFLTQYHRIFSHTTRTIRIFFNSCSAFVLAWAVAQLILSVFVCTPIKSYWDSSVKGRCVPNYPLWQVNAAGNIVSDVVIFVLPIPVIKGLHLPRRQRYILMGIFSLGLFTVCISLVRVRYLKQYEDFTWENVDSSGWSLGEIATGLTCACLPTLRPLASKLMPWIGSAGGSSGRGSDRRYAQYGSNSRSAARHNRTGHTIEKDDIELGTGTTLGTNKRRTVAGFATRTNNTASTRQTIDSGHDHRRTNSAESSPTRPSGLDTDNDELPFAQTGAGSSSERTTAKDLASASNNSSIVQTEGSSSSTGSSENILGLKSATAAAAGTKKKSTSPTSSFDAGKGQKDGWKHRGPTAGWKTKETMPWGGPGIQTEITTPSAAFSSRPSERTSSLPMSAIRVERNIYQREDPLS